MPHFVLTLDAILDEVGPRPVQKANNARVLQVKLSRGQKRFLFLVKAFEPYSSPHGHLVSVFFPRLPDPKTLLANPQLTPMNRRVRIYCTCPAWQYWGSAYWADLGGYRILGPKYVEKRPPHIRDPYRENVCCKHVVRVAQYLYRTSFLKLFKENKLPLDKVQKKATQDEIRATVAAVRPEVTLPSDFTEEDLAYHGLVVDAAEDPLQSFSPLLSEPDPPPATDFPPEFW